ncbi:MAG TPA: VLRF1 family aeRF1-type release factor [Longimicrobiales bacterium]|nr:VLRF1 family aeRF1-type release factor [Longimicrobiales bacterium]
MISGNDIQTLIGQDNQGREILSLFLDMSVNSDNKRTHTIFLNKEKARFAELQSDRERHHREPLGATFERVERWLNEDFDPTNKGVAIYADIGGDWFQAFQLPAPLRNRLEILPHPVIGPLTEIVRSHPRYGIIVVDREHLRLLSLHMGVVGEDYRLEPEPIDSPHDIQAGGYSQKGNQKRKAEETRHFFKDFADEVARFDQRVEADHYLLLGTNENTQHFREFLTKSITDRIIHNGTAPPTAGAGDIVAAITPVLDDLARQHEAQALDVVQDRVRQSHFATSGIHDTLVQLQEGKVQRLVVARDLSRDGVQCTQCGFFLARRTGACPYCGGELQDGIDLVESMIRIAANQDIALDFVASDTMRDLKGVAALLKF